MAVVDRTRRTITFLNQVGKCHQTDVPNYVQKALGINEGSIMSLRQFIRMRVTTDETTVTVPQPQALV